MRAKEFLALYFFALSLFMFAWAYRQIDTAYNFKHMEHELLQKYKLDVTITDTAVFRNKEFTSEEILTSGYQIGLFGLILNLISFILLGVDGCERVERTSKIHKRQ